MTNQEIGLRIKSKRDEKGYSLQEVADKIGVTKSTVQRYEAGLIERVKLPVIAAIGDALGINPAWLLGKVDSPDVPTPFADPSELGRPYFNFAKELQDKQIPEEDFEKIIKLYEMYKNM